MAGRVELVTRSPRMTRALARGPRALLLSAVAVLAIAGARNAIAGSEGPAPPPRAPAGGQDLVAAGFAQSFARAYLTWDAGRPELHAEQVAPYVSQRLDAGAGLALPDRGSQGVLWTAAVQDRRTGERERTITVAAQTTRSLVTSRCPYSAIGAAFWSCRAIRRSSGHR